MGGLSPAMQMPTFVLHTCANTGCVQRDVRSDVGMRRLPCNPKGFWSAWKQDILQFQTDWRKSERELLLEASMKCTAGIFPVKVLVDTGAKIPLVFRRGLIEPASLKAAVFPVQFSTVDGRPMEGGSKGLLLELRLPACVNQDILMVRTLPLFAYEGDIHDIDVIIGYPFLKVFNLCINATHDRLFLGSPISSELMLVPQSVEHEAQTLHNQQTPEGAHHSEECSSDELRCLLFCKSVDTEGDCCQFAKKIRLAALAASLDVSTSETAVAALDVMPLRPISVGDVMIIAHEGWSEIPGDTPPCGYQRQPVMH